jgi:hypothetical protein
LLAALLGTFAAAAGAQPSEIDKDAARTLVQQGDERRSAGDYAGALEAYRRADDIMGVPTTGIEVGRMELKLGHLVKALEAFERVAESPVTEGEPGPFTEARAEAQKKAEDLFARVPKLSVQVSGPPADVTVELTIDDAPASLPVDRQRFDPGPHVVTATADGYTSASETVELGEYDDRTVDLRLEVAPDTLWPMMWTGYGISAAALVLGTVTGAISLTKASEARDWCDDEGRCTAEAESPRDLSLSLAHVSTASFITAGVAAAVGTAGLLISLMAEDQQTRDEEPPAEADAVEADVALGLGGATLRIRF